MKFIKKILSLIKSPITVGVVVLFLSIGVIIFSSRILYQRTVDLLIENLRERIQTISITAAANIEASDLEELQVKDDWKKPEWAYVVNKLHKIKYGNDDVVFMYIFRKIKDDPTQMEFIADADSIDPFTSVDVNRDGIIESDGPDKLQWPGQPYPEAVDIPEAFAAYEKPLTSAELYTDKYGTVMTGYAPIKDKLGNTVAVLATDIKADDFFTITRQTLLPFIIFIVSLTLIISVLTIILILTWRRYSKFIEKYAVELKESNYLLALANGRLKDLDKQKTEFISLATHQIRGPLGAIKGHASLALEGDYGEINTGARKAFETIIHSAQGLVVIVNDYLDVSRIEQGRMKYDISEFDLKDIAKDVVNEILPTIYSKALTIDFKCDQSLTYIVKGDQGKIIQVMSNIFDNSIKYSTEGHIRSSLEKKDGKIIFSVKDNGIGIKPEVLPNLFIKFSRAPDASRTNILGTGLGLYVARKIIEAHNGRVWAESEGQGKGSQFYVELEEKK